MRREFVLRAVSHNVQSLRQPESIELVISDAGSTRLGGHGEGSGVVEAVGYERGPSGHSADRSALSSACPVNGVAPGNNN